jgi:hypothetical protein
VSDLCPVRPVTMSTQVPAEPDRVFDYLADTRNDPEWCPNVSEVRLVEGKGVDVGSRFVFHQRVETQGRELVSDVDVEVVELGSVTSDGGLKIGFRSAMSCSESSPMKAARR